MLDSKELYHTRKVFNDLNAMKRMMELGGISFRTDADELTFRRLVGSMELNNRVVNKILREAQELENQKKMEDESNFNLMEWLNSKD